jgi:hypothetical protein
MTFEYSKDKRYIRMLSSPIDWFAHLVCALDNRIFLDRKYHRYCLIGPKMRLLSPEPQLKVDIGLHK